MTIRDSYNVKAGAVLVLCLVDLVFNALAAMWSYTPISQLLLQL